MQIVSVSDIQKNPSVISQATEPVSVFDKRKNINLGIFYPKTRKKSLVDELAGSLKPVPEVLEKTKNMSFQEIRDEARSIHYAEKYKKSFI